MNPAMRVLYVTGFVALNCLLISCAHSKRSVEIPVRGSGSPDQEATVLVEIPVDWRPLTPSPARVEFLAPDNSSRAYVRAMPAGVDIKRCPNLARKYSSEFIEAWGRPPETRVASKTSTGDKVDFELRRRDPKPQGEVIWARVVCREGALAVASCAVATSREQKLRRQCRDVLESLQVFPHRKPAALATTHRK